ncbi:MAG: hypothetical protein GWN00_31495 [Aliifodinibius sp.]|nr:hypothetical protein [Fodinibius sp.]NIV15278.1 hypothetical protein [Fodinibius sp.]NIY29147.1 hypothetical protein [Fodinibius sp.]
MKKQIFLDMDGVIVDWDAMVRETFGVDWYPTEWNIPYKEVFGMSRDRFWKAIDYGFWWANIPWTNDGREIYNVVKPWKPCILTVAKTFGAMNGKRGWVERELPDVYEAGKCFIINGPSKHLVAHPNAVLIDDCDHFCTEWENHGGKAILYPRPWNENRNIKEPLEYLKRMLAEYM